MAKPTAANAKTQAAAIATALNAALHDTVLTGIHPDWKYPSHPMRKWSKFVKMDNQGTFTADDDYIDSAYADKEYTSALSKRSDRTTEAPS
jgi:hypothetical protein